MTPLNSLIPWCKKSLKLPFKFISIQKVFFRMCLEMVKSWSSFQLSLTFFFRCSAHFWHLHWAAKFFCKQTCMVGRSHGQQLHFIVNHVTMNRKFTDNNCINSSWGLHMIQRDNIYILWIYYAFIENIFSSVFFVTLSGWTQHILD